MIKITAPKALHNRKSSKSELVAEKIRKLKEFIEIANKIPPDHPAIDIRELAREVWEAELPTQAPFQLAPGRMTVYPRLPVRKPPPAEGSLESWVFEFRVLLSYLEKFPSDFRAYVLEDSVEHLSQIDLKGLGSDVDNTHLSKIYGALRRYKEFRELREKLRKIARLAKPDVPRWQRFFEGSILVHSTLRVGAHGTLELNLEPFVEVVQGLEANKIRECPICGVLFWADRKDQKGCTTACANIYRVRRYRGQRAENRRYKRRQLKPGKSRKED